MVILEKKTTDQIKYLTKLFDLAEKAFELKNFQLVFILSSVLNN